MSMESHVQQESAHKICRRWHNFEFVKEIEQGNLESEAQNKKQIIQILMNDKLLLSSSCLYLTYLTHSL